MKNYPSNLSTEQFNSNVALPAVNEYADGLQKSAMFDPIPADASIKKNNLAQSSQQNSQHNLNGQSVDRKDNSI